ncbi:MAG: hypothetical protein LBH95_07930 [Oscillospiraceae bacterium]|jgi:hypothetical protein|nr:hypothetical protein [Oscillospiraceae bacterium]
MNTDLFTGKAQAYASARPGYPDKAMAYIRSLCPPGAVFADIGAGTGKFTAAFFTNPAAKEFLNPVSYTRDSWLRYMTSHSHDPLPSDPGYEAHIAEMNAMFGRENENGLMRRGTVTKVYSERID